MTPPRKVNELDNADVIKFASALIQEATRRGLEVPEIAALKDVKSKAAIVIAGWELMSKTSEYDLDTLKESLRKCVVTGGEA